MALTRTISQVFGRLMAFLAAGGDRTRRGGALTAPEVLELLRGYPKLRYQGLVLQQVLDVYISLRGHLTDTLREINFCRVRLTELSQSLEDAAEEANKPDAPRAAAGGGKSGAGSQADYDPEVEGPGQYLSPEGCLDVDAAVQRAESALGRDELLELDERLQKMIRRQFVALVQACLASGNVTRNVATAMRGVAEAFVEEKLSTADVAGLFRHHHGDEEQALNGLIELYEEAIPDVTRTPQARAVGAQAEVVVLATPPGRDGETLRRIVQSALPDTALVAGASGDDLLVYREWSNLALTDLELLGPTGQQAYRQLLNSDNFSPHTRQDVEFELPV